MMGLVYSSDLSNVLHLILVLLSAREARDHLGRLLPRGIYDSRAVRVPC